MHRKNTFILNIFMGISAILGIHTGCDINTTPNEQSYLPIDDSYCPYNGLPRLVIETENFSEIRDKEVKHNAKLQIYDKNGPLAEPVPLTIKGRGNTSWSYPKYSYTLSLKTTQSLLNLPKGKNWVLLANYRDRTLIRNAVALQLAQQTDLEWTPHGSHVELYLNRQFLGTYFLCEKISIEDNRIRDAEIDYLIEFDTYYDETIKFKTKYSSIPTNIKFPKFLTNDEQKFIQSQLNIIDCILSGNCSNLKLIDYIDIESFADYLLINELCTNRDPIQPKSFFANIKKDGKIYAGPVWDFDWGTFNLNRTGWQIISGPIYKNISKNKIFSQKLKEEWDKHKPDFQNISVFIDSVAAYTSLSNESNIKRWPIVLDDTGVTGDEKKSFDESILMLKKALFHRMDEMDSLINAL